MIDSTKGFTLVRNLDATPAAIWDAWTRPDEAARWLHPRGLSTPRDSVTLDVRAGGRYEYTMVHDSTGERYVTGGEYREVVPREKLVFTWGGTEENPDESPLITVTIEPLGELTRLRFDLRGTDGMRGDADVFDGWDSALDVLAGYLGQAEMRG
jgi:uncharacterized protein YndB with AHSA1/START domain